MAKTALAAIHPVRDFGERVIFRQGKRCFREMMDHLSAEALPVYRTLVHEDPAVFEMLLQTTPVKTAAPVWLW